MKFKPLRKAENVSLLTSMLGPSITETEEAFLVDHFHMRLQGDNNQASSDFGMQDIEFGKTVLAGTTTRGAYEMGVVTGCVPGQYFTFDGVNANSKLWHDVLLIKGDAADKLLEIHTKFKETFGDGPRPMSRTDSGSNYGFSGYPDLALWKRLGIPAWYRVDAEDYLCRDYGSSWSNDKHRLQERIQEFRSILESGSDETGPVSAHSRAVAQPLTEDEREALSYQISQMEAKLANL